MGKKGKKKPQEGGGEQGQGPSQGTSQQQHPPQQGQRRDGGQQQRDGAPHGGTAQGAGGDTRQGGGRQEQPQRGSGDRQRQGPQQPGPPQPAGPFMQQQRPFTAAPFQQEQGRGRGRGQHGPGGTPQPVVGGPSQQPRGPPPGQVGGQQQQSGPSPPWGGQSSPGHQQPGGPPGFGGQGGPRPQQQGGPAWGGQQQGRGPPQQQQQGQQQQRGPEQQQRGPQQQGQQQQRGPQQQQRGPQQQGQQQQRGPQQQQRGPQQQRDPQQQQRGPPPQQQQWNPQQQQRGPPQQQQRSPQQQQPAPKPISPEGFQSSEVSVARSMSRMEISEEKETMTIPDVFKPPGTLCKKIIPVESNHFALRTGGIKQAIHYDVEILENLTEREKERQKKEAASSPSKEGRARRIKDKVQFAVMQKFLNEKFKGRFPSFDGRKNLYASRPLHEDLNQIFSHNNIEVIDDMGKQKSFNITIKYARTLSLEPIFADPANRVKVLPQDAIQCIDIVLRNAPICTYTQVGRSFFKKPTDTIINLGGGMEMYYGFYQSVVMGGRPMLNVHLAHKAFPKNMPVLDAFIEILKSNDRRRDAHYSLKDLETLNDYQRKDLTAYIKSLKVTYEVPRQPKVTYRVNGLADLPGREKLDDGRTVMEYFRTEKNYTIKYPNIPLIWVGSLKGKVKIPPELCTIEKDQTLRRKMDEIQTSNMIKVAATDTKKHKANTMRRFMDANYNASPHVREFGFSVNDKFERMDARVLPPPMLQYREGTARVDKGVWRNNNFHTAKTVDRWAIVSLDSYVRQGDLEGVKSALFSASRQCGIQFASDPDYPQIRIRHPRNGASQGELEQFFLEQKRQNYNIIFVILPNFNGDAVYSSVKNASEIKAGCLTQCIKSGTLRKLNPQTALNILLKVNGKLDGVNHTFASKPTILQDRRPFMFLGADVTHPGPTAGNIPSVAAIIASHDPTGFQYNVTIRLQEPRMEYIVDLKNVVKEQLLFFFKKNRGAKPEKIFYFRDGVSEGQFSHVLCMELKAIQAACMEVQQNGGYNPKIAFLVVQKRHHTRLFPVNDRDSEDQGRPDKPGNFNVPAGTCVDTHIVDPNRQNFYLVSHASIKGVARPTKYCTLYDDMDLTNDQIQELTYYLCHMFARCNRSVSYPAPTYYAHLGALRGKAYIKPAMDQGQFNMDRLQAEQDKIKTLPVIHDNTPMFFI